LKAVLHGTRVLLLSDLGRAGQNTLLQRTSDLRADIVVAGLPAADEPLSNSLIEAIHPRLVIISDSEFPISERASLKLRIRLRRTKLPVLYTRSAGAVSLEFRDGSWALRTMNGIELNSRQTDLASIINEFEGRSPGFSRPGVDEKAGPFDSDENPSESSDES